MVLSNKKLKQKLRASLSVTEGDLNNQNPNPDSNSNSSLKQLIDFASQKPRLSKREKRRQPTSAETVKQEEGSKVGEKKNKNTKKKKQTKKRKREEADDGEQQTVNIKEKMVKKKKKPKKSVGDKLAVNQDQLVIPVGSQKNKNGGESRMQEESATKVYVGGIPYYSTEDDIRSYFEGCGSITEVDCMTFPDSGKFRGIALISFKTEGAAKRALALDGSEMGGLLLKIQPYKSTRVKRSSDFAPKILEGYNRIYVGNLSYDITEDELTKFFSDCTISSIRWGTDKETGEFRGYAHVDFADSLSLKTALTLDQHVVFGRPVKISCAVPLKGPKTPANGGTTTGEADASGITVPAATSQDADDIGVGAGKMKRRTCFLCKEKGHVSSACPKNQTAHTPHTDTKTSSVIGTTTSKSMPIDTSGLNSAPAARNESADNTGVSAGKIKRRTCYLCKEKGHLSSACPKNQTANPSVGSTS